MSRDPIVHGKPGQASSSLTANGTPASAPSQGRPDLSAIAEVGHRVQCAEVVDPGERGLGQVRGSDLPLAHEPRHLDGVPPAVVALCDKHAPIVNDMIAFGNAA